MDNIFIENTSTTQVKSLPKPSEFYFISDDESRDTKGFILSWSVNNTVKVSPDRYNLTSLRRNIRILNSLLQLRENWNGNNAEPFHENQLNRVVSIIRELDYQPKIFPTARQSIQLEYEKANGDYLEFEIYEDHIISYSEINDVEIEEHVEEDGIKRKVLEFHG